MARVPAHPFLAPVTTGRVSAGPGRTAQRLFLFVLVVCVALLPMGRAAHAEPSVAEIEAQIDKQWEQLEPTIEQYNKVRSELKKNQKKVAGLQKKMRPLALRTELAMSRVGALASRYYKTGPSSSLNALLETGTASTLTRQLTLLDQLARSEQRQIASVVTVLDKYAAQKGKLDGIIAQLRKQEAELAARKKQIDAEVKRLQDMLPYTTVKVAGCPTVKGKFSEKAAIAIKTACAQVGDPYVWGADGPDSFDCSGLTSYAWAKANVYLPHFTGDQWQMGRRVSKADALPGDLIFFFGDLHHVGLYLGNGLMVHAPNPRTVVKTANIYYIDQGRIAGFRRIG